VPVAFVLLVDVSKQYLLGWVTKNINEIDGKWVTGCGFTISFTKECKGRTAIYYCALEST